MYSRHSKARVVIPLDFKTPLPGIGQRRQAGDCGSAVEMAVEPDRQPIAGFSLLQGHLPIKDESTPNVRL